MGPMDDEAMDSEVLRGALDERAERTLMHHRSRFVDWLARKTRNRELAEEIVHTAYVRALERGTPAAGDEGVVAWFQTVLRNAWLDRARRAGVESGVSRRLAADVEEGVSGPELRDAVCACVHDAIEELKP